MSTPTQGLAPGVSSGFHRAPSSGRLAEETAEHKSWSPQATPPPAPASGPTFPWMASAAEAPSLHSEKRTPGPCSPGGHQAQTGPQAEWGAPSQEDEGFPVHQWDEGSCLHTARGAPPGEAGEAPGGGPRQTITHLPRREAPWVAQLAQSGSVGPSHPSQPCKGGAPARISGWHGRAGAGRTPRPSSLHSPEPAVEVAGDGDRLVSTP